MHRIRITVAVNVKSSDRDPPCPGFFWKTVDRCVNLSGKTYSESNAPVFWVHHNAHQDRRDSGSSIHRGFFLYGGVCILCIFNVKSYKSYFEKFTSILHILHIDRFVKGGRAESLGSGQMKNGCQSHAQNDRKTKRGCRCVARLPKHAL